MDRRGFLGCGALAGAGALAGRSEAGALPVEVPAFELDEVTLADLQQQMAAGERSSRQITEAYLARIAALDRRGPALRSVIEMNPEALEIAAALDAERTREGRARAAARHPGADQGQHRHRRPDDDDRRLAGARGLDPDARRARRASACARPAP